MSVIANAADDAAPFDDETPTENVRYDFKVTEENKEKRITLTLNEDVREYITETHIRSARWRSLGQFVNDALIYYLNGASGDRSVENIIEGASWTDGRQTTVAITESLWREIDLLVKHGHTEWDTKQEFYICALFAFIGDGLPVVETR